ncbi:MAG: phosphate acetyltransferase [Candidatus Omnitrophica bacterium]|nr:phosphate acetyltransferase [Candidatus Omnitrophota bacterium]
MNILTQIRDKAKFNLRKIILCETNDERIIKAVKKIVSERIAKIVLVGEREKILKNFLPQEIQELEIIASDEPSVINDFAIKYCQLKNNAVDLRAAKRILSDPLYLAAMALKKDRADGLVAGATRTTAEVLKSLISILGCKNSLSISGAFLMEIPNCALGENGVFIFADCGVIPDPSAKQLANIALASAELFKLLVNKKPKVAMLSFSTNGSATHKTLDKVLEATNIVRRISPDLDVDGEIQADAALIPEIAECKFPGNRVKGKANVLIFPDLNCGNITYKLIERLAKAKAIGPLLQNLNKPVSDLSRGCSVENIVDAVGITAVRAAEPATRLTPHAKDKK